VVPDDIAQTVGNLGNVQLGADPDQLDRLARVFAGAAAQVRSVERRIAQSRERATGASASRKIAAVLMGEIEPALRRLANHLADRSDALRNRAERQRRASQPARPLSGLVTIRENQLGDGRWVGRAGPADATTLVVLVPGVGTHHGHRRRLGREAIRLRKHLVTEYPLNSVAVIAWIGYDAPDSVVAGIDGRPATIAARELAADLTNWRASGAERVVLVGHSYGALVATRAVASGTHVEELVLLGAPGIGVDDTSSLRLAEGGQIWTAMEEDDRIEWVARAGVLHGSNPASISRRLPTSSSGHASYLSDPVLIEALGQLVMRQRN
jgi:pimeloyl-ACP methyl ester carboxylesterase